MNTPCDYAELDWNANSRALEWKNYICEELEQAWPTFTLEQRAMLARNADWLASLENWA